MSARRLSQLVVVAFVFFGVLASVARYRAREASRTAEDNSLWRLTYDVSFETDLNVESQDATAVVTIGRPFPTPFSEIEKENIVSPDPSLRVENRESRSTKNREYRMSTRHAQKYRVTAEFFLRLHSDRMQNQYSALESLSAVRRDLYTRSELTFPTESARISELVQQAPTGDVPRGEQLQWFFEYCQRDLRAPNVEDEGDDVKWALVANRTTPLGRARVFVTLCRAVGVPARLVTGFELRNAYQAQPHVWAEVHRENRWIPYDPANGYALNMPHWFVPVRRGGEKILLAKNAKNVQETYSIFGLPPDPTVVQAEVRRTSQILDLTRLPLESHELLSLALLLPWGALITAVFRNLIGLRTLGTFAPALLAMSFIYAAWGTGLVVLLVVVIAGLVGRTLLERLHLLMVPRLSIVLTLIILCVAFGVSLLNYYWPTESARAVLLPLVILTILIERFFVTTEEDGAAYAIQLVLGTVVVAAFCYLLLRWDYVGNLVLIHPEVHLFTIAAFILIGRYSGYRLTELWRFRDVAQEET